MCFFHSWSNWKIDSDKIVSYTTVMGGRGRVREVIQSKQCSKCGLIKYNVQDIE